VWRALSGYRSTVTGKPLARTRLGRFDAAAAAVTARARGESVHQVLDRNLGELLQELRVAITLRLPARPGVHAALR
jgi:hypothetical protein